LVDHLLRRSNELNPVPGFLLESGDDLPDRLVLLRGKAVLHRTTRSAL
jgi:hypothetical protein